MAGTNMALNERIKAAQLEEKTSLDGLDLSVDGVQFSYDTDGYTWCAWDGWRTKYPTKGQWVVFFKTLAGAKRNFLRRYQK